ncbi:hypothetical protein EVAR_33264_1 [Eumeta japonica]|uniref:Uncharacterized protein n=1 Tax=Eumeta variegata TaxID=151549 RepID=A0A4C1X108_EUMVA|nr:hypothetical protein EVAR_33264_1 [Eumeta japonica]
MDCQVDRRSPSKRGLSTSTVELGSAERNLAYKWVMFFTVGVRRASRLTFAPNTRSIPRLAIPKTAVAVIVSKPDRYRRTDGWTTTHL